ncbi:MAG: hypothetical protein II727_10295 [Oscillospiraceae bacterium]|nr:hypothetical protein [Oscillospiraceae bacterium]
MTNQAFYVIFELPAWGRHPSEKTQAGLSRPKAKGEIPIEKNVIVVDEQGKQIGVTYPKRARGLVKKGRARYVDACTICLACPPDENLEDLQMNENTINIPEEFEQTNDAAQETWERPITPKYILESIEEIIRKQKYLESAIAQIENLEPEAAMAISQIVEKREVTNQKLIDFYQQAYEKLVTPPDLAHIPEITKIDYKRDIANKLIEEIKNAQDEETKKALSNGLHGFMVSW